MSPQTTMCMHVTFAPRIQSPSLNRNVSTPQCMGVRRGGGGGGGGGGSMGSNDPPSPKRGHLHHWILFLNSNRHTCMLKSTIAFTRTTRCR